MSYDQVKRCLDIFLSITILILLIPLWLLVAILIKVETPRGPILFKQRRVGKGEKRFVMYKFRSMVVDAEKMKINLEEYNVHEGPIFKMQQDPRVTRVGKLLRKTSIDEFPQLINVIRGDMSLIGPRPPLESEVKKYTSNQKKRLLIKPGCTGLWQVSGRSNLDFDSMLQLDIQYINNYNASMDFEILVRTFKVILTGDGAY